MPEISIHALCEEGDGAGLLLSTCKQLFLSTPSARRATTIFESNYLPYIFLSTPSARRATCHNSRPIYDCRFLSTPSARRATKTLRQTWEASAISIHALREEGDVATLNYPKIIRKFLSTPSARRATAYGGGMA